MACRIEGCIDFDSEGKCKKCGTNAPKNKDGYLIWYPEEVEKFQ